ncbi:hypothetical protein F4553_000612 [Allocatelliglobosispora scoriae]|uniref:Uncharacterized protein n=1 Tax=Allocatelliglobosispora scoriae TaxID=643052 RepID=A0A841BJM7_9ACTN|nr:hypothetical protein [Allocatelliglobosispora scoriae]MBB5867233.1 hypothetical protein [Allocatelliglobosispora scoriae]
MCASLTHPALTSFTPPLTGTAPVSCDGILQNSSGLRPLIWNGVPSMTSQWSFTASATTVNGTHIHTAQGPITSGVLSGATVVKQQAIPNTDLAACDSAGGLLVSSGPTIWVITQT